MISDDGHHDSTRTVCVVRVVPTVDNRSVRLCALLTTSSNRHRLTCSYPTHYCLWVHTHYVASGRVSLPLLSVSTNTSWVAHMGRYLIITDSYPVPASFYLHTVTSNVYISLHTCITFSSVHLSAANSLSLLSASNPTYTRQLHHHEAEHFVFKFLCEASREQQFQTHTIGWQYS